MHVQAAEALEKFGAAPFALCVNQRHPMPSWRFAAIADRATAKQKNFGRKRCTCVLHTNCIPDQFSTIFHSCSFAYVTKWNFCGLKNFYPAKKHILKIICSKLRLLRFRLSDVLIWVHVINAKKPKGIISAGSMAIPRRLVWFGCPK